MEKKTPIPRRPVAVVMSSSSVVHQEIVDIQWKKLPGPFSAGRCFGAAAVVRNDNNNGNEPVGILFAGGEHHATGDAMTCVEMLEWKLCEWWPMSPINRERSGCAVATIQNTVYVIGGADAAARPLATAECWTFGCSATTESISSSFWRELPSNMTTPRWFCGAVGIARHQMIVVAGGRDETWHALNSVEAYDVRRQVWTRLPSMTTQRFGCALVALGHTRIMVIGGLNGQQAQAQALYTCQVYNMDNDDGYWSDMAPMPIAFAFCSATVVNNRDSRYVFVTGKRMDQIRDSNTPTANNVIQCYCERTNKWTVLRTSEHLEAGSILSFGDELIFIEGQQQKKPPGNNFATTKCRRWNFSQIDLATFWSERTVVDDDGYSRNGRVRRVSIAEDVATDVAADDTTLQSGRTNSAIMSRRTFRTTRGSSLGSGGGGQTPVAIPVAEVVTEQEIYATEATRDNSTESHHHNLSSSGPREIINVTDHPIEDVHGEEAWYTGELCSRTNKPHGKGRLRRDFVGEVYDGEWCDGERHGLGLTIYRSSNDSHEGCYRMGKRHGRAKFKWNDGREYRGNYVDDLPEDPKGTLVWKDGRTYVGQVSKGERTGRGRMVFPNGDKYEGEFVNGKYEGFGTLWFHDGKVYEGSWKGNQANGMGVLKGANGDILHEGEWDRDRPVH